MTKTTENTNVVSLLKTCKCGRASHRPGARNCYLCNRDAQRKYKAALKGPMELAQEIRERDRKGIPGFIYFFRAGERGMIKIGFSKNPQKRLKNLQVGSPHLLYFLGAVPAYQALEQLFHARFQAYRTGGEWFEPAEELLEFIEGLMNNANTHAIKGNTMRQRIAFGGY